MYIPKITPDILAEIYYLTAEEGGRKSWVGNGYRGQFYYNGRDWDAPQEFIDKDICNPGEKVNVYLRTLSPQYHIGKFFIGKIFEIREGAKVVGKGRIIDIIRPDFNIPNFKEDIIDSIHEFCKKEIKLTPDTFYKYLSSIEHLQHLATHFYYPIDDMASLFEVLEYEQILEYVYGCEYKRII